VHFGALHIEDRNEPLETLLIELALVLFQVGSVPVLAQESYEARRPGKDGV
jgi:hypothetical protein